ncbi:MAG: glutamine--fructose-6-phosphate transaminase (isomerizing) [Pseudomonadota bacterium]
MCGIIGYVGGSEATPIILDGLKRLEYRGYDSAGIAVIGARGIEVQRAEGKLDNLEKLVAANPMEGRIGIGHTRWATHGRPSEENAHPHRSGDIVVVHNGIIENYMELRKFLSGKDYAFTSETDTEVICHLINHFHGGGATPMLEAVRKAIDKLTGSYAIVVMNARDKDRLYVVKRGSPMVLGQGKGESFAASDIPALLPYTKDMIFLEDGDHAVLSAGGMQIYGEDGKEIVRKPQHIPWTPLMAERGGFKHFMLKEIFEQPQGIEDTMTGRLDRKQGRVVLNELSSLFVGGKPAFDRIAIVACGTSWHAGMVGKYFIESLARMPVMVDLASEFRYREPLIDKRTLVLAISQSGETADTLAAETMSREMGSKVLAICNVVGSSLARHADSVLYTHAGPEIGVASTKAFTAQLAALYLFALHLGAVMGKIDAATLSERTEELLALPRLVKGMLARSGAIRAMAERISDATHVLFIGRGANFPVALEGALKLKEISYVHAEGFAAGELKHGPIALIDYGVPVVAIAPRDATYEKLLSNIEEVRARGAEVYALATEGDDIIRQKSQDVISLPRTSPYLTPILAAVPLQLLAYYVADHKGTDVDQPRNLAKSVTVE